MNGSEVTRYANLALSTLQLKGDYSVAVGLKNHVLIVEGATDETFIGQIRHPDARCYTISKLIRATSAFATKPAPPVNNKELIVEILKRLVRSPEFFGFPKGSEKWPLFGMVDRDYDEPGRFAEIRHLFFTDTHDLETMMLSTDGTLLTRLTNCPIDPANVKKALYLACQLAHYRVAIYGEGTLDVKLMNEPDGSIAFERFTDGLLIDPKRLLAMIGERQPNGPSREKLNKVLRAVLQKMKKYVDKDGVWKKPFETFEADRRDEFWQITNGHDILSAVRFVCPDAGSRFSDAGSFSRNRDFEFALQAVYDFDCFRSTDLFRHLSDNGLVVTARRVM